MPKTVNFAWLPEEGHEAAATAVAKEAVQCTDTDNMNYEDSIYASYEKETNFIKEKSRLVI